MPDIIITNPKSGQLYYYVSVCGLTIHPRIFRLGDAFDEFLWSTSNHFLTRHEAREWGRRNGDTLKCATVFK